jgi:hypothetical protein
LREDEAMTDGYINWLRSVAGTPAAGGNPDAGYPHDERTTNPMKAARQMPAVVRQCRRRKANEDHPIRRMAALAGA